jgi:hypothetical protein
MRIARLALLFRTALWLSASVSCHAAEPPARIVVDPFCQRSIGGVCDLDRRVFFGLCDQGTSFDERCRTPARYEYLVKENGITFGRTMNVVSGLEQWDKAIRQDPARAGFVDLAYLQEKLRNTRREPTQGFKADMGGRLHVAAHDHAGGFPEFMGRHSLPAAEKDAHSPPLPENISAAAELSAAALKHRFTDFDRPAFYEPINEPHWAAWRGEHLARWHLATHEAVHREAPEVQVGGPCLPVPYFYKKGYKGLDGLASFIANTGCRLDFYSFHVYDYLREVGGDFGGRITSGLPLESVLDLVENHTVNTHGREVPLVVSEHGGYGADELVERLAEKHFPGDGFEWEMRKRSIDDFNMVSSVVANTLVFMDHPHVVKKAVPFILLQAFDWDPKFYAVLYVPRDYTDKSDWVPTRKILFYTLFRDLAGRRVVADCPDPDIQARAFVDGRTLFVILDNLSRVPQPAVLTIPTPQRLDVRRLSLAADFTPAFDEETVEKPATLLEQLVLAPRETVILRAGYPADLSPKQAIDERIHYGDAIAADVEGEARFSVRVRDPKRAVRATLRIGVSRPPEAGHAVRVVLNGRQLEVPLEDCAERLVEEEYASCKLIPVDVGVLEETNDVRLSFPDGKPGSVGAVVIRAAVPEPPR